MTPIVRKPRKGELEKIERILQEADKWQVAVYGIDFLVLTIPGREKGARRLIVGCIGIAEGNRICYLAVDPIHRRKGYARKLLNSALRQINGDAYLRVRFTNFKAIRLYWSAKFRITGTYYRRSWVMTYRKKEETPALPAQNPIEKVIARTPPAFINLMKAGYKLDPRGKFPTFLRYGPLHIHESLPLGEVISAELDTPVDLKDLKDRIRYQRGLDPTVIEAINSLDGPDWMPWKTNKGTWTKRLESYLFKQYKYKIPSDEMSQVGNIVARYKPYEYKIQIVDKIDWKQGEFGDHHGCWTGGDPYGHGKYFFSMGRGFGIKAFKPGTKEGMGRCWIYSNNEHLFLFNPNGPEIDWYARILAHALKMEYKSIRLDVNGNRDGKIRGSYGTTSFYVDSSSCYVVGRNIPENMKNYIMNWSKDGP